MNVCARGCRHAVRVLMLSAMRCAVWCCCHHHHIVDQGLIVVALLAAQRALGIMRDCIAPRHARADILRPLAENFDPPKSCRSSLTLNLLT